MEVEVPLITNEQCTKAYHGLPTDDGQICAHAPGGGLDSCQGDSGGPLTYLDKSSNSWFQVGVVSVGKDCGHAEYPGIYARVSEYLEWIRSNTDDSMDQSPTTEPVDDDCHLYGECHDDDPYHFDDVDPSENDYFAHTDPCFYDYRECYYPYDGDDDYPYDGDYDHYSGMSGRSRSSSSKKICIGFQTAYDHKDAASTGTRGTFKVFVQLQGQNKKHRVTTSNEILPNKAYKFCGKENISGGKQNIEKVLVKGTGLNTDGVKITGFHVILNNEKFYFAGPVDSNGGWWIDTDRDERRYGRCAAGKRCGLIPQRREP